MQNGQERKPDLVCSLEKEGFLGSFYQGDRYVDKAVIFVGGSGEPRNVVEARAAILAREGYSVLAVGYYLWKPLSKQTVAIPLDYVERCDRLVKGKMSGEGNQDRYDRTFTWCCLHGTFAVLIFHKSVVRSLFRALILWWKAAKNMVIRQHRSYFTLHGENIPYEPAEALSHLPATLKKWKKDPCYGSSAMNRFYYNECFKDRTDASRIKVENGNCDWLFLAPGYDDTWPSDQAVKRIIQVLQEKQYPHRYECVIYEKRKPSAGHAK